jgi:hypothetical protein
MTETQLLSHGAAGFTTCEAVMYKQNLRIISRRLSLQLNAFLFISYLFVDLYVFLGAPAKLRKATISFVMSVRPSVLLSAWNNLAPTGRIFMKFGF